MSFVLAVEKPSTCVQIVSFSLSTYLCVLLALQQVTSNLTIVLQAVTVLQSIMLTCMNTFIIIIEVLHFSQASLFHTRNGSNSVFHSETYHLPIYTLSCEHSRIFGMPYCCTCTQWQFSSGVLYL